MKRKFTLNSLGYVNNPVKERHKEPPQNFDSEIVIFPEYAEAMSGLEKGKRIWVIGYLDRSDTRVLQARNQRGGDDTLKGVFSISSPDRPCPVSLSKAEIISVKGQTINVKGLDLLDKTPVFDIKTIKSND